MKYRLVVYTSPTDMLEPMPLAAFDGPAYTAYTAYTAWLAGWASVHPVFRCGW